MLGRLIEWSVRNVFLVLVMTLAIVAGGIYALISDNVARTILPGEIPLGILTSLFGAALFIVLLSTNTLGVRR